MRHSHHHIVRGWQRKKRFLYLSLAALLPGLFLFIAGAYLRLSLAELFSALGLSLARLSIAYAISLVAGVLAAVLVGAGKRGAENWTAVFDVAQNIPSFALIPLFALLMGYSNIMIIVFAATSIVWPILFSTLSAIRTAHPSLNDAATVFGARGIKRVRYYLMPIAYPAIITGSIVGISIGWEAVIGAEIIGSFQGIGSFLNSAGQGGETLLLLSGLAALLLLVFFINRLVWTPLLKHTYEYSD